MKIRLSSILIALLLFACTKEEVTPRVFPRVNTLGATNITSGGATFQAEITYSNVPIIDHGFLWSQSTEASFANADKLSLGPKNEAGPFEAQCDRGLQEGQKYYLRAYAISEDHTVFGKAVEFVSLGSKAPVFKDFFPAIGTWDDTVTIVGENFSRVLNQDVVKFSGTNATVIKASSDTLQVLVPYSLSSEFSTVTISLFGNSVNHTKQFQLKAPIIESVTPDIGLSNTTVTITGKLLNGVNNKLYFGDTEASPTSWSATKIECKVPVRPNGDVLLKVVTGSGGLFATYPFKIQAEHLPELHLVQPATAYIGETIKLTGDFFATEPGQNTVKFDDVPAGIVSESKTEIEVIVPLPNRRKPVISVTSYGSTVTTDLFTLKSPVITDFTPHRAGPSSNIVITGQHLFAGTLKVLLDNEELPIQSVYNDQIYTTIPSELKNHTSTLKVVHYDEEFVLSQPFTSPWIASQDFPGTDLTQAECLVYNNMAYVGLTGNNVQSNQFWRFSAASNQWTQLNDFPGTKRFNAFSFIIGTKGYVGGGDIDPFQQTRELWEYDFATDTWTQQADIPMQGYTVQGFAVGGEAFAFDQDFDAGQIKLWQYNAAADTWSIKPTPPLDANGYLRYFVIGTSVYFLQDSWPFPQNLWKYTPSTNQWTNLGQTPDSFSYAYTMSGAGYAGNRYSCYKFNPGSNTWSQEPSFNAYDNPVVGFSLNGKGYIVGSSQNDSYDFVYEFDPNF